MPQLAPLSWVFLSFFLFFVIFLCLCGIWWMKKESLKVVFSSSASAGSHFWAW